MFVFIKYHVGDVLQPGQTIFPRPTPWAVAWRAFYEYLRGQSVYRFVYFPAKYLHLLKYDVYVEGDEVVLRDGGAEVLHTPVLPMSALTWAFYIIESWATGLLFAVWNHRLFAGSPRLTRRELLDKLERVQGELDRLRDRGNQEDE